MPPPGKPDTTGGCSWCTQREFVQQRERTITAELLDENGGLYSSLQLEKANSAKLTLEISQLKALAAQAAVAQEQAVKLCQASAAREVAAVRESAERELVTVRLAAEQQRASLNDQIAQLSNLLRDQGKCPECAETLRGGTYYVKRHMTRKHGRPYEQGRTGRPLGAKDKNPRMTNAEKAELAAVKQLLHDYDEAMAAERAKAAEKAAEAKHQARVRRAENRLFSTVTYK